MVGGVAQNRVTVGCCEMMHSVVFFYEMIHSRFPPKSFVLVSEELP